MRKSPLKRAVGKQIMSRPLTANCTLNFSGDQLARLQAASTANIAVGGKRGDDRSLLKLPWKVSDEISTSVRQLAMEKGSGEKGGSGMRDRASGLNSFMGSSVPTTSADDLMSGRATEVFTRGIQERLRVIKAARAKAGDEKKFGGSGTSPIKEISKTIKKRTLKEKGFTMIAEAVATSELHVPAPGVEGKGEGDLNKMRDNLTGTQGEDCHGQ
ncbi:unnamed protein product [Urochloa humidicola]